ncbi:MAG: dihydroorotate dehydrogenase [Anaerolineales bacterium]
MADLQVRIAGVTFRNPLIISSGPLTYNAEAILKTWREGASGAVTKTITLRPAINPTPHIARADAPGSLLNSEKWSDLPADQWIHEEIPALRAAGGGIIIASVGHTAADVEALASPLAEAGAHMLEVVSYRSDDMAPAVRIAKASTGVPVFAKVSANWPDLLEIVEACLRVGADGITAIDSIGPALAIDIETRRPRLEGPWGFGWLSGAAIKPIAVRVVAEIALRWDVPILGVGGIAKAEDIVEMVMAGATAVQAHTAPLLHGPGWIGKTLNRLDQWLNAHGFPSVANARGAALPSLRDAEDSRPLGFAYDPETCTECGRCVAVCAYGALGLDNKRMERDRTRCRSCGLCASVCPTGALRISGKAGDTAA